MRKYPKMHIMFEETASSISIDLATNQVENWKFGHSVSINYKTSDMCLLKFEQNDSHELLSYRGYVPDFMPNKHYGDYVNLDISAKGIVRKMAITDADIDSLLNEVDTDDEDEDDDEEDSEDSGAIKIR